MAKYLGETGLIYLWNKIKNLVNTYVKITSVNNVNTLTVGNVSTTIQEKITSDSKLSADLIVDGITNKVYTANEQSKLSGIETGAEVNQNAFSNIKVGSSTIAADSKTDTLELAIGTNSVVSLTADTTNDKVTIDVDKDLSKYDNTTSGFLTSADITEVKIDGLTGSTINRYGTCSTAAATAAKTANITTGNLPTLDASANGLRVTINFENENTADSPTLNIGSKGSKNIYFRGQQITTNNVKKMLYGVCDFIYDNSTGWHLVASDYDSKRIINGLEHSTYQDSAQYDYAVCSTAAGTAAKTAAASNNNSNVSLSIRQSGSNVYCPTGTYVLVNFQNANTADNPTFSYWSTTACPIYHRGARITTGANKALLAGVCTLVFDGTNWNLVGNYYDTIAATADPIMDGTAAVGTSTKYAREDHVHPTDTSRAAAEHTHGNITNDGKLQTTDVIIANGDKLVVTDSSDSNKVARASISFDGSTTSKALSQKGTWETFLNSGNVGAANGICPLDSNTKIDSAYLPSYVDDVVEAYPVTGATRLSAGWLSETSGGTALTPEAGKIYVLMQAVTFTDPDASSDHSTDTVTWPIGTEFRWGGTSYAKINDGGLSEMTATEMDTATNNWT